MSSRPLTRSEDLYRHPDLTVQVWDWKLSERSVADIMRWNDLSKSAVKKILAEDPPEIIARDPRYLTGKISEWRSVGGTGLFDKNGDWSAFVVIIRPSGLSQAVFRKGLRAIRRGIREEVPGFDFAPVAEESEIHILLAIAERRGYQVWEVFEDGSAGKHDGRFADLLGLHDDPEEEPSPC